MPPVAENGVMPPDEKGFVYYSKEKYHAGFAADLSKKETEFMYASQGAFAAKSFATPLTQAAWKIKAQLWNSWQQKTKAFDQRSKKKCT